MANSFPNQDWMGRCEAVDSLTPMEFCFPGTHDTGAYQKPDLRPVVSNDAFAKCKLRFCVEGTITRWSVTQPNCDVYKQLMNGVRFLDLRIAYTVYEGKPSYFLVHTFAMSRLDDVLADIKRFVESHPTEMIVMNVQPYYEIDDALLQDIFQKELGQWMCSNSHGSNAIPETISSILKADKRIIAIYRFQTQPISNLWFSEAEMITSGIRYESHSSVPKKQEFLRRGLDEYAAHRSENRPQLFQLAYTLTPSAWDVVAGFIHTSSSLARLGQKMNRTLQSFLRPLNEERKLINIITVDDVDHSNVVDVCKSLVAERQFGTGAASLVV